MIIHARIGRRDPHRIISCGAVTAGDVSEARQPIFVVLRGGVAVHAVREINQKITRFGRVGQTGEHVFLLGPRALVQIVAVEVDRIPFGIKQDYAAMSR